MKTFKQYFTEGHGIDEIRDNPEVIESTRAYKRLTNIRRIPIASYNDEIIFGNDNIEKYGLKIKGKEDKYLSDEETINLFKDEVVIEEKVDGHPQVLLWKGFSWFGENLSFVHTVNYSDIPEPSPNIRDKRIVFPRGVMIYDIKRGENYKVDGKWMTRSQKVKMCYNEGAPLVPVLFQGKISPEELPEIAEGLSGLGTEQREGVVVKNLTRGIFGKFINVEFQKAISDEELTGQEHPELSKVPHNIKNRRMAWN